MRLASLLVALTAAGGASAQNALLTLSESDLDSATREVRLSEAVDINSTLEIRIDKAALRARLAKDHPELPAKEIETIAKIQSWAAAALEALPQMRQALANWSDPEKRSAAAAAIARVAGPMKSILAEAMKTELGPEIDARLESATAAGVAISAADQYAIVLEVASAYVNRRLLEVDRRIAENRIYLQLGAWTRSAAGGGSTPIHLAGFDTLPEQEFFEVERWRLKALLSEENRARFEAAQKAANDIKSGAKDIASLVRESLPEALITGIAEQRACIEDLDDPLRDLRESASAQLTKLRSTTDEARKAVREYRDYIRGLESRYRAVRTATVFDLPALYSSVRSDANELERRTTALTGRLEGLAGQLQGVLAALASEEQEAAKQLAAKARQCKQGISDQLRTLRSMAGLLVNTGEIVEASLEYSDKVLRHDIGSLPDRATLDLRQTGRRQAGDILIVRLGSAGAERSGQVMEQRSVKMHEILTHADVAVSLIFANPRKETQLKSEFQPAPSYSILLKRGRRDSNFWNELLKPGIGLNIAALDFNSDQSLEVGVGLTVSVFSDYLQVGYGYNLNFGSGYWFLGLKLPLPNQPGAPSP
jgi:hypothetical protein